jgi:hypothetical protein
MQRVQTSRRFAPAPTFAHALEVRRRRFVLLFAWLTLWPEDRCLPHTSQARAKGRSVPRGLGAAQARMSCSSTRLCQVDALDPPPAADLVGAAMISAQSALKARQGEVPDQRQRRVVVEDGDDVDGAQRGDDLGAVFLRHQRAILSLAEPAHRGVAVDAHHQQVAEGARRAEVAHVPRVDQVETAVRERDATTARGDRPGVPPARRVRRELQDVHADHHSAPTADAPRGA